MIPLYFLLLLLLGIYSYSQIDLNLTLLQQSWFLAFQNQMIQLGYFNRPISTVIFTVLTLLLFVFYFLWVFKSERISIKKLMVAVLGIGILGVLSYPSFSHDIFNYIFDARIAVFHKANPYTSTALMFPQDTWTRFMNWTHRTYPYGPAFLPISIVLYVFGFNKFVFTLLIFKAAIVSAYLGSSYLIYKTAGKKALAIFAFNPLIIYEMVIASHLDGLMLFFAVLGYYFLIQRKTLGSIISLLISIGIKYVTVLFLPIFYFPKISMERKLKFLIVAGYLGAIIQVGSRELLPHYFIVPLGFAALLPEKKTLFWLGMFLSVILILVRYLPFLYFGQWLPIVF